MPVEEPAFYLSNSVLLVTSRASEAVESFPFCVWTSTRRRRLAALSFSTSTRSQRARDFSIRRFIHPVIVLFPSSDICLNSIYEILAHSDSIYFLCRVKSYLSAHQS